jgi:hypothetical protein
MLIKKIVITIIILLLVAFNVGAVEINVLTDKSGTVATTGLVPCDATAAGSATSGKCTISSILALKTTVSGNAGTATALAADPANCAAGQVAVGVNASGVAECTATPSGLTSVGATTFTGDLTGKSTGTTASEIDGHATGAITLVNGADNVITNYGQDADCTVTLPAPVSGDRFTAIAGTTVANYWRIKAATNDSIYLIATDGSITKGDDNHYVGVASIAIGNSFSCRAFKTGASAYDWLCGGISGTWTAE